jgi:hypothetical protein
VRRFGTERHAVTADAGNRAAALGDLGQGVCRHPEQKYGVLQTGGADAFRRRSKAELRKPLLQCRAAMA